MALLEHHQQQHQHMLPSQQSITELSGQRQNIDSLYTNGFLTSVQSGVGQNVGVSPGVNGSGMYNPTVEQQQQQQQMSLPSMSVAQSAPPLYVPTSHPSHPLLNASLNASPVGAASYPASQPPVVANSPWSLDSRQYGGTGQCYSSPLPAWPRPDNGGYVDSKQWQSPSLSPLMSYMRPDVGTWGSYSQAISSFSPQYPHSTGTSDSHYR